MSVSIILDTGGEQPAGQNYENLVADVRAEVEGFAQSAGGKTTEKMKAAPENAQGAESLIEFIVDVAQNPAMYKAYAQALLYGLDQIIKGIRGDDARSEQSTGDQAELPLDRGAKLKLKIAAKEIALPATTAAISEFIEGLGGSDA
ncbi:MAG: hypothetical protein ACK4MH_07085 [Brevundimonas sp.]|uniref:hypothetical protein n=1 Tax=Brevundimonas sp. TaxID=1871086 RepID=UPI00391BEF68